MVNYYERVITQGADYLVTFMESSMSTSTRERVHFSPETTDSLDLYSTCLFEQG